MATGPLREMLKRNKLFAEAYKAPPGLLQLAAKLRENRSGIVVVSCSDPRLNPYQILGLDSTLNATMVRNAGGRVFDAIRSLAVLQTIGAPATIAVMHHTDCGMTHFHDKDVRKALMEIAPEEEAVIQQTAFGEITNSIEESIRDDLRILKASPFIRKETQLIGLMYDIHTGILSEVELEEENKL